MALEDLIRSLTRDAEGEATGILDAARVEAAAIRSAAESAEAGRRSAAAVTRVAAKASGISAAVSAARLEVRRDVLTARRDVVNRVLEAARAALPAALERPAYRAGLVRDAEAALLCVGDRGATFRCHPALAPILSPLVKGRAGIRVAADPSCGSGFRVATDDGSLEIDATLEARLAGQEIRLAQEVARREAMA